MRKGLILAAASVMVLSACSAASDKAEEYTAEAAPADAASEAPVEARATTAPDAAAAARVTAPRPAPLAPVARIADAYQYALSLPRDRARR